MNTKGWDLMDWVKFGAAVFVVGVAIGTLGTIFPALKSIGQGFNLSRAS